MALRGKLIPKVLILKEKQNSNLIVQLNKLEKEQDKHKHDYLNEEITNLPEKEFRVMIVKKI